MDVTNYQVGGEVRASIENTEHDGERTSSNDRVPPSRFTTEDGMPNLPQDEHKQEEDAICFGTKAYGPVIIRVAAAFISRRITSIESQSLMVMIREDFEAMNEARAAVIVAEKELSSTYDFVNDRLAEADEAAIRARVCVTLWTDELASEETVQAIEDTLAELGYSAVRSQGRRRVYTSSRVTYGAAPNWILSELTGVVRDHQQTPTDFSLDKWWGDDDWDVFVDVVTNPFTHLINDEEEEEEEDETGGFEGLGSLFG